MVWLSLYDYVVVFIETKNNLSTATVVERRFQFDSCLNRCCIESNNCDSDNLFYVLKVDSFELDGKNGYKGQVTYTNPDGTLTRISCIMPHTGRLRDVTTKVALQKDIDRLLGAAQWDGCAIDEAAFGVLDDVRELPSLYDLYTHHVGEEPFHPDE